MLVRLIIAVLVLALVLWGLASMARDGSMNRSTFPGITESLYGDPRLTAPGVPGSVDVPGVSYPDITAGIYGDPQIAAPDLPGPLSDELFPMGPTRDEMGIAPTGHHAGFDGWGPTPDFSAPSLNERAQFQGVSDRIVNDPWDADIARLNDGLMAELRGPVHPAGRLRAAPRVHPHPGKPVSDHGTGSAGGSGPEDQGSRGRTGPQWLMGSNG